VSGTVDVQVPYIGYTVNEALCPRPYFPGNPNATRPYHFVNSSVAKSQTVLVTVWNTTPGLVWGDIGTGSGVVSHRPVHGFASSGTLDLYTLPAGADEGGGRMGGTGYTGGAYWPVSAAGGELSATAPVGDQGNGSSATRLDWVGHNHPGGGINYSNGKTNFSYVDGHVETKMVIDTVQQGAFEWGDKCYTLNPCDDVGTQH